VPPIQWHGTAVQAQTSASDVSLPFQLQDHRTPQPRFDASPTELGLWRKKKVLRLPVSF
jgi:hypothetical protein